MRARFCLALVPAVLLLTACGGGGGGDDGGNNPPPPPPEQFTIGGTVSGLQGDGDLVLQLNDAGDLSIADDGDFTFDDSIDEGSTYEVTVLSTRKGQLCEVSNGSGTATADVTDIEVTCSADPSAFYTVFTATGPAGPDVGLYAVFSKDIGGEPVHVADANVDALGYALNVTVDGSGNVSRGNPDAFFYVTRDASGGDHVWALDLSGTSALAPRQLTDTTFSNSSDPAQSLEGCAKNVVYEDLNDPDSAFLLLELPPTGGNCADAVGHEARKLIRLSDAADASGVDLPGGLASIQALYATDGTLSGFIALDDAGNFSYYADETFTNPTLLRTAVDAFETLADAVSPLVLDNDLSPTPSVVLVKLQFQNGSNAVYRVDQAGTISTALYSWQGLPQITYASDSTYLYVSSQSAATNFSGEIVRMRLRGAGSAEELYTEGPVPGDTSALYIIGTIGTQLILQRPVDVAPVTAEHTAYIAALDLTAPAEPVVIARSSNSIQARLRDGGIFLNIGLDTKDYSSAIVGPDGTEIQALTAKTAFVGSGLQVRDITRATGVGGGSFYKVSISSGAAVRTPITAVDGSPYELPNGTDLPYVRAISPDIALGIAPPVAGNDSFALTFDLDNNTVAPHAIDGLDATYSAIFF